MKSLPLEGKVPPVRTLGADEVFPLYDAGSKTHLDTSSVIRLA